MKLNETDQTSKSRQLRIPLRRVGWIASALVFGVALSECGSSDSGGTGNPTTGNGGSAVGAGGTGNQAGNTGNSGGSTAGTGGTTTGVGGSTTGTGGSTGSGGTVGTGGTAGTAGTGGSAGTGGAAGRDAGGAGTGGAPGTGGTVVRDAGVDTGTPGTGGAPAMEAGATRPVAGLPEYWVSPTGSDAAAGTQAAPFYTLTKAVSFLRPGTASTIWVMPGTYSYAVTVQLTLAGTQAAPFNIKAVAGATKPILDFALQPQNTSSLRGFDISGNWWHLTGLEIEHSADNCINIGGSNNTIENVVVHECGDTGVQITVDGDLAGDPTKGANNTILNCDSWGNLDVATGGENADGFACKLAIGPGNVFRGCRSWNNADDGWDFFAANDVVTVDNCWAFLNGKTLSGAGNPQGDGNGFKLGGKQSGTDLGGAVHKVTNSFAFENLACGFTRNNNVDVPSLAMCGSVRNGSDAYCPSTTDFTMSAANNGFTMTGAQAKAVVRNADGTLPAIR
jgi:hypothetical protein